MTNWRIVLLAALAVGVPAVGCGGATHDDLGSVDSLDTDADYQGLLFYTSTQQDAPGLYAYDPSQPDRGGIRVDPDLSLRTPHTFTLQAGSVDQSAQTISDMHNGQIFYTAKSSPPDNAPVGNGLFYGEQYRISTDPAKLDAGPIRVSASTIPAALFSTTDRFWSYDPPNLLDSSVAVRSATDGWIRIRMNEEASDEPDTFGDDVGVVGPIWDRDAHHAGQWLVAAPGDDDQSPVRTLTAVDSELAAIDVVHYAGTGEPVDEVDNAKLVQDFGDGTGLIILNKSPDDPARLFLYASDNPATDAGTLKELVNEEGDPLLISSTALGFAQHEGSVELAGAELRRVSGNALYFAVGPDLLHPQRWTHLYRVDHDGWTVYNHKNHVQDTSGPDLGDFGADISAGIKSRLAPFLVKIDTDKFVWSLGEKLRVIDTSDPDGANWTQRVIEVDADTAEGTPVYGTAGGWVYYNTDHQAVAVHASLGESVVLDDTTWIGASSGSTPTPLTNVQTRTLNISEVFLLRDGRQLGAVDAANPVGGMVNLGSLDEPADEVRLFGNAFGPHRLAQVQYDDESVSVVYMSTRRAGSLEPLTEHISDREDVLDSGSTIEYSAQSTRPLNRF